MEELSTLRLFLEEGRYEDALLLINELEEMSKEDKLNKIDSYATILLIHLIKQAAENRTTRSWNNSINFTVREIHKINNRRKAGGRYADRDTLKAILADAYALALAKAAEESYEGMYQDAELEQKFDKEEVLHKALALIDEA